MEQFQLTANDWNWVSLLSAEHLSVETRYLEEVQRWMAYYGIPSGIAKLSEGSLRISTSDFDYEIVLSDCRAFSPCGYPMNVVEPLSYSNTHKNHSEGVVPIYLGVSVEKESLPCTPSQSRNLVEGRSMARHYKLTTEREDSEYDWLLIGCLRKSGSQYVLDEKFIPDCLHLESHPELIRMAEQISQTAQQSLDLLSKFLSRDQGSRGWVQPYTGILANAIAPACVVVNWRSSPLAYVERLTEVLESLKTVMWLVREDLSSGRQQAWDEAHNQITKTLGTIYNDSRPNSKVDYGHSLTEIEKSLRAFVRMLEALSQDKPGVSTQQRLEVESHVPVKDIGGKPQTDEGRSKFTIGRR